MERQQVHSEIMARLAEKQAGQEVQIVNAMPSLYDVQDYVMLGSFSWYQQLAKKRTLLRPFAMYWPEVVATPSDLVRTYLDVKYPKLRALRSQLDLWRQYRSAPLYAQPHRCEQGVYVDIRSAYWSITQVLGWDCDYYPGEFLGRGKPMLDFPYPDFKLTRNCLTTAGLNGERNIWDGFKQAYKPVKMGNRHSNLGLWAVTLDVLNGIARDCIGAGAFYVHTDGFICDSRNLGNIQEAIAGWGLESTIKAAGQTEVYGVGSYNVGGKVTKTPKQSNHFDGVALSDHHSWLRSRFKFFADRTEFQWDSGVNKDRLTHASNMAESLAISIHGSLSEKLQTPTQSPETGSIGESITERSTQENQGEQLSFFSHPSLRNTKTSVKYD